MGKDIEGKYPEDQQAEAWSQIVKDFRMDEVCRTGIAHRMGLSIDIGNEETVICFIEYPGKDADLMETGEMMGAAWSHHVVRQAEDGAEPRDASGSGKGDRQDSSGVLP